MTDARSLSAISSVLVTVFPILSLLAAAQEKKRISIYRGAQSHCLHHE